MPKKPKPKKKFYEKLPTGDWTSDENFFYKEWESLAVTIQDNVPELDLIEPLEYNEGILFKVYTKKGGQQLFIPVDLCLALARLSIELNEMTNDYENLSAEIEGVEVEDSGSTWEEDQ